MLLDSGILKIIKNENGKLELVSNSNNKKFNIKSTEEI